MPEWLMQLLVSAGGLGMIGAMGKAWWTAFRDDRKTKLDAEATYKKSLEAKVERLQDKVESLLMDAAAKGQDDRREKAELIAALNKINELSASMVDALKDATKARMRDSP